MKLFIASLLTLLIGTTCVTAQPNRPNDQSEKGSEPMRTVDEKEPSVDAITRIVIPTVDGNVHWDSIVEALCEELGIEPTNLNGLVPSGKLNIDRAGSRLAIIGFNAAMRPAIRISVDRRHQSVIVTLDKEKLSELPRSITRRIREKLDAIDEERLPPTGLHPFESIEDVTVESSSPTETPGAKADTSWRQADHVVIVVHGLNSNPSEFAALGQFLAEFASDHQIDVVPVSFHFRSRGGISQAADLLLEEIANLTDENPDVEISLVTHSMGGIVARCAVERDGFDVPQIQRLIMIAPPNGGSNLAKLPLGSDRIDTALAEIEAEPIRDAVRGWVSQINPAIGELRPDSDFLQRLNTQSRAEGIEYSILLGQVAIFEPAQAAIVTAAMRKFNQDQIPGVSQVAGDVEVILNDLADEWTAPQGDGAVSVQSGQLEDVEDIELLPFRHRDISRDGTPAQSQIFAKIAKRLFPGQ